MDAADRQPDCTVHPVIRGRGTVTLVEAGGSCTSVRRAVATAAAIQSPEDPRVFAQPMTPPARRSPVVDELERRYLDLHEGDREAAARNLAVDLMMVEAQSIEAGPAPDPATLRRFQRAAIKACGVLRLPMGHAMTIYTDTVEYAREHLLPGPSGLRGTPITRWEAAALTTQRAA